MSVTAHSPFLGHKRLHRDTDSPDHAGSCSPKRLRAFSGSPPPSCARRERRAYRVGRTTVAALRGLFPGMDEKVVVDVLDACGQDIDEAIKRLGGLQLSLGGGGRCGEASGAAPATATPFASPPLSPPPEPRAEPDAHQQAPDEPPARTPAQWVEGLVGEMAAARDVADARGRAAEQLRAFEQAVLRSAARARAGEVAGLQARLGEVQKENAVLKRAVAIQQTRLQEAAAAGRQQAAQAQEAIQQLQGKVHSLEMSNYSLSMHLRQATGAVQPERSHPDIF